MFAEEGRRRSRRRFDEMVAAAEKLTDPSRTAPTASSAAACSNANMTLWTNSSSTTAASSSTPRATSCTDGPEAIEATKLYQTTDDQVRTSRRRRLQLDRSRSPPSRKAARRCGSTASAGPRRWRIRQASRVVGKVGYARRAGRTQGAVSGDLSATASAYRRPARRRRPPISLPVGGVEGHGRAAAAGRRRRAVPQLGARTIPRSREGVKMPPEWLRCGDRLRQRSASSACRSSSRSPSSATSSARR